MAFCARNSVSAIVWPASVRTWSEGTRTLGCSKSLEGENTFINNYIWTLAILEIRKLFQACEILQNQASKLCATDQLTVSLNKYHVH